MADDAHLFRRLWTTPICFGGPASRIEYNALRCLNFQK